MELQRIGRHSSLHKHRNIRWRFKILHWREQEKNHPCLLTWQVPYHSSSHRLLVLRFGTESVRRRILIWFGAQEPYIFLYVVLYSQNLGLAHFSYELTTWFRTLPHPEDPLEQISTAVAEDRNTNVTMNKRTETNCGGEEIKNAEGKLKSVTPWNDKLGVPMGLFDISREQKPDSPARTLSLFWLLYPASYNAGF